MTKPHETPEGVARRRQMVYWRLLTTVFEQNDKGKNLDKVTAQVAGEVGLPDQILDPVIGIDALLQRHPQLASEFEEVVPPPSVDEETGELVPGGPPGLDQAEDPQGLRRALIVSKVLLNVFGPNANRSHITAAQYAQWNQDVAAFERAFGYTPGALRGRAQPGGGAGRGRGSNMAPMTEEELRRGLGAMESDLIKRMALREVLQDSKLAAKLTPSAALMEQLLRDKNHLSGVALQNAKMLIKKYIDELAQVLKLEVERATGKKIDPRIPPKRTFRNLDLKKTIWKNLTNYNEGEQRLYVDRLYYKPSVQKKMSNRIIIVVDQSGSMVDSMVNCTILASIFAGLPKVDPHLIAYDTQYIDLSPWVHDPFEVLLRTNLGGGTRGMVCMDCVRSKITNPKSTCLVWISDYYDCEDERLFGALKSIKDSGVTLIPVGSVGASGYLSINDWFKQKFRSIGTPLISGSVKTLVKEIKQFII
jgi:hypothetical protein